MKGTMKNQTHTPGPWRRGGKKKAHGMIVSETTREVVAICLDDKDGWLVAAAPELLEALEGCLLFFTSAKAAAWIEANRADDKDWAMAAAMEIRRDQALAAIAKATGKGGE